jgi:nucleoside-diphosphate-sugar epimerase
LSITILGGGGFLGAKLARRLARDGRLGGRPVEALTLFDLQPPPPVDAPFPVRCLGGDVSDPAALAAAIPPETRVVVHLAAVVSAQAEADFDLGLKVNLHGTLSVLAACRALPSPARVVFTSSVASFGGGQGAVLPDDARQVPENSYGAQKAMGELLLADASRRGMVDAVSIRLPTVTVRPGRPNKAASSFVSASCASRCSACRPNSRWTRTSPSGSARPAARWSGCCTRWPWTPRPWAPTAA